MKAGRELDAVTKIKEKYEQQLEGVKQSIIDYESSKNHELRIASRTLKAEAEELSIIVDALSKQVLIKVLTEYDNEFICPTCGETTEDYDVTIMKVCPNCGQRLNWGCVE